MRQIVFYSWQSDLPNSCNRGLIQDALETAAAAIAADETVSIEPVIDRDTKNVPGSPDISSTIFAKIAAADIFVADISIISSTKAKRATPNPNVLIELGYALKALGHERVILVFNRAFGPIEALPFDLRMRHVLAYEMPEDSSDGRAPERNRLAKQLEDALRTALGAITTKEELDTRIPAVVSIENAAANRTLILRRNLDSILAKIDSIEPTKHRDGGTAEELITAIGKTQEVVAEFSKIAEVIAVMDDAAAAVEVNRWFGKLFVRFSLPENYSGPFSEADQDYFKFIGDELFVTFIAFLIKEQKWDTLVRVLDEPIPMSYIANHGPGNVGWEYASKHLTLLMEEAAKRRRVSLHADLLRDRHSDGGGLATVLPFEDFMAADFFLFLLSETLKDDAGFRMRYWRAWSCLFLKRAPSFVRNAEHKRVAERLANLFGLSSVEEFKKFLDEHGPNIAKLFRADMFWDYPIRKEDIDRIGSR